jgi:hypothetical protein
LNQITLGQTTLADAISLADGSVSGNLPEVAQLFICLNGFGFWSLTLRPNAVRL